MEPFWKQDRVGTGLTCTAPHCSLWSGTFWWEENWPEGAFSAAFSGRVTCKFRASLKIAD